MGNVHQGAEWGGRRRTVDGGGPKGEGGDTEIRLTKLESTLPSLATKADLEKGFHDLVKWVVGTALVVAGMGITIMTFVLNNAVPKPQPAAAPPPITIQAPPMQPPLIIQMPPPPEAATPKARSSSR
jgi:hypothetical protein